MSSHHPSTVDNHVPLLHNHGGGDSLSILIEQECTSYACSHYFNFNSDKYSLLRRTNQDASEKITTNDRSKNVDWCYNIADQCHFSRECVAVAMDMVHWFMIIGIAGGGSRLCLQGNLQELCGNDIVLPHYCCRRYQLLVMTTLYISIKLSD